MDITVEKLQYFLEYAWTKAPASANSLRDQMFAFEVSVREVARGGTIGSFSKNSASQSSQGPGLGQYTPDQLGDGWRMLINLYDGTQRALNFAALHPPTNPPADWPTVPADGDWDSQVYPLMTDRLRRGTVTEYEVDLTDLRLMQTYGGAGATCTW